MRALSWTVIFPEVLTLDLNLMGNRGVITSFVSSAPLFLIDPSFKNTILTSFPNSDLEDIQRHLILPQSPSSVIIYYYSKIRLSTKLLYCQSIFLSTFDPIPEVAGDLITVCLKVPQHMSLAFLQ